MAYAQFIDSTYVFNNTPIDSNVDPIKVNIAIKEAQELNIKSILGQELYTKIFNDILGTGTTTGYYLTLLTDYIQRCQAYWAVYHVLPTLQYNLSNKGVTEKHSEYSESSELDKIIFLRKDAESKAQFFGQRITEYIINNAEHFPEYYQQSGLGIQPKSNNYFGGIYLPNRQK